MADYPQMIAGGYVLPGEKKKKKPTAAKPAEVRPPAPTPQEPTMAMGGPGYAPGADFPRQAPAPEAPAVASWFDMFAAPGGLAVPQMPQMPTAAPQPQGPGQPSVTPPVDPLTAFLMARNGQQQQPMIPQFNPAELVKALRYDPVSEHSRLASLPSYAPESQSPFATGFFNQPSQMGLSPEAVLASQGGTATNQWAQLGGVPNIDPELLRRLNMAGATARRF